MVFCNALYEELVETIKESHNPYFNRWFSAIKMDKYPSNLVQAVTILILIDGFLQWNHIHHSIFVSEKVTILILIDGFLQ